MNKETLGSAVMAANHFLDTARAIENRELDDQGVDWSWPGGGTRETGALRRASMELTRALAELRKCP